MNTAQIKLCGMRSPADIELANRYLPGYCGFVLVPHSRRYVTPDTAQTLREMLDPRIAAVGVFADADAEHIASLLNSGTIDIAQLHGAEDDRYIARLREFTDKPIIKAFHVRSTVDIELAAGSSADYVLLDGSRGGEGRAFDLSLARALKRRYFLAGGLNPENVADAVAAVHPFAVDVSSGIERNGVKDAELIRSFIDAVRSFDCPNACTRDLMKG